MKAVRVLGLSIVLLAGVPGCNEGQQQSQTGDDARADRSSGGESGDADRPARPGGGDEMPDGDLEREAGAQPPAAGGGTTPGAAQQSGGSGSPWGTPDAQSGRPLPPRQAMNGTARGHYQRGLQLAAAGNASGAADAFQAALSADGNAFKAAYNLGVLADRAGQEGRALQYYQQSLRIQADYERAIEGIARIHLRRGNNVEAVNFVRPLADQWERNLHVQAVFGDVLVQANRPEEAVTAARRALRRDERFVPAMVVLVKANMRLGRNELAESILTQAIETNPNHAELQYLRGRLYQDQNHLGPALAAYRRAIELEPGYTEARMALGLQQLAAGNYAEALSQFQVTAQLAPTQPAVRLALGDALRATKQWQQAKAEFDRVQELSPTNAQVHFNLGMLYREAGGDFPGLGIIEAYQRAVAELNRYRELMGPRLQRDDPSHAYLEELARMIEREQRTQQRDRERAERERQRAARQQAEGGGEAPAQ